MNYLIAPARKKANFQSVIDVVCEYFEISELDILSDSRIRKLAFARHIICHIVRNNIMQHSLHDIGRRINKHHTTIVKSINRANNLIGIDEEFTLYHKEIVSLLNSQYSTMAQAFSESYNVLAQYKGDEKPQFLYKKYEFYSILISNNTVTTKDKKNKKTYKSIQNFLNEWDIITKK